MIIFKKIRWKNFLSTGNVFSEVDLQASKTNLIVGSNGAGKSTILDALTFSLFGKPFRKINKPMLVNSINEKDLMTEIEFSIGKKDYLVRRGIKPNVFDIEVNGTLLHKEADDRSNQKILEENILKVTGKGNKERFAPLGKIAIIEIKKYLNNRDKLKINSKFSDILFLNRYGRQLTRSMIFKVINDSSKNAEIDKKISPHTLRHSYATHLLKNGADLRTIQLILGHESITTTEIYTHLDTFHLEDVLKKYHPRENKN